MSSAGSFDDLMAKLQAGDQEAATRVFHQFACRLIALAGHRLDRHVRAKIGAEDLVQSVFRSFFTRHSAGKFHLDNWGDLWGTLVVITLRKCGRVSQYFHAARRDVQREVEMPAAEEGSAQDWEARAPEPTPAEAALLTEMVEDLMHWLEEDEREMLALRLQGYEIAEISSRVGRTERTVYRVLERVRQRLGRLRNEDRNQS